jgi:RNA polymerase sigma-70 factor (ECF subfamily)
VILLEGYVRHFVAREFDQLRELLAQDVRLEVVGIAQNRGAQQVGGYFHRYDSLEGWRPAMGLVEGRPSILVYDAQSGSESPAYFILIDWSEGQVVRIRDYRYARYMMTDAQFVEL